MLKTDDDNNINNDDRDEDLLHTFIQLCLNMYELHTPTPTPTHTQTKTQAHTHITSYTYTRKRNSHAAWENPFNPKRRSTNCPVCSLSKDAALIWSLGAAGM